MRFEVSYRTGSVHEVELAAGLIVIGRDPGCDLVLNDAKCSRRHAVVEQGPEGLSVRDCDSANGIYLNGRRVERSALSPGDTLRMGDVRLKVLADVAETIVVGPEDLEAATASDMPRPELPTPVPFEPPARERPERRSARAAAPRPPAERPLTVTVLALLWALSVPFSLLLPLLLARRLGAGLVGFAVAGMTAFALAGAGAALALGLRALAPWARHLQIAAAALGLVVCPFTPASATVLFYMVRPEVKAAFEGRAEGADGGAEATFALSLAGLLALGVALSAAAFFFFGAGR